MAQTVIEVINTDEKLAVVRDGDNGPILTKDGGLWGMVWRRQKGGEGTEVFPGHEVSTIYGTIVTGPGIGTQLIGEFVRARYEEDISPSGVRSVFRKIG